MNSKQKTILLMMSRIDFYEGFDGVARYTVHYFPKTIMKNELAFRYPLVYQTNEYNKASIQG